MASATKSIAVAILALIGVALSGGAGAQDAEPEDSIELVDPHVFRACADPRDLPFSNEAGEGFENKIAELFARSSASRSPTRSIPTRPASSATRSTRIVATSSWELPKATTSFNRPTPIIEPSYVAAYRADGPLKGLEFA